ncbi:MAG: hypothetical protein WBL80_05365 [Erysipelotrichaceae bacterium]
MAEKSRTEPISKPYINISVIACWKCKNDMIASYYSDDITAPVGPSSFTNQQIEIARQAGCILQDSFSKNMETSYLATVCPVCGSSVGESYYRDFAGTPGDVRYFLDEKDGILERIENRKLERRITDKFDETEHKNDIELKKSSTIINPTDYINKGICVLVLFEDDRMYKYNCRFDVKIGDIVKVEGKMSDKLGEVVELEGEWDRQEYMKEIVEILSSEFKAFSISDNLNQRNTDKQRAQKEDSYSEEHMVGFSMEYQIIIDESDPDSPIKLWFDTFDICNEKLRNTEMYTTATVKSNYFEVYAISHIQCDYSFGGEFTCYEKYIFDRLNTEKFYQSLDQSTDLIRLSEIVKEKFGGHSGLKTLEEYCREKDIKYEYTHRYEE